MSDNAFSRFLRATKSRLLDSGAQPIPGADSGRRTFFRRAGLGAVGAIGTGLMMPDDAWAAVEERANEFGITPGTIVDAQGRPVRSQGAEPYLGEIMLCGWNFAARGWALCQGQLLPIASYSALFSLLGTMYGGDGRTTFGLPELRGRFPMGWGTGPGLSPNSLGEKGGSETRTLTTAQIPSHNHPQRSDSQAGTVANPDGNIPAQAPGRVTNYAPIAAGDGFLDGSSQTGGGQSFNIMNPYQVINMQIALQGIFPSRS